jgi:uncharacterized membrane protein
MSWRVFLLFLHILAAILAFGTATLAFPFIGAFAEKNPAHLNFSLRLSYALGKRAVTPLALTTFALGIALVIVGKWDLFANEWLLISIGLFLVTVVDAQLVTLPSVGKLARLTESAPAEGEMPVEVRRLVRKVRIGGTFSALLLVTITLLMVWKPGAGS